jgi:hypothetical protein
LERVYHLKEGTTWSKMVFYLKASLSLFSTQRMELQKKGTILLALKIRWQG